jgi:uncharacterized protein (TIGR02266 family)
MRFPDLDTFAERFAPNITRGGVFIATRAPRPVGDVFAFEIQISTGQVALAGEGKVIWVKDFDPAQPNRPHGMGVQFAALSAASKELLARMLKIKSAQPTAPGRAVSRAYATVAAPRVDTNVDLAAEFGLDETQLRRALDRAWGPGGRPTEDDLQSLQRSEPTEKPTLAQALADFPRMLDTSARRRSTGAFRTLENVAPVVVAVTTNGETIATPENGVTAQTHRERD